jgi:mRNA interferase RelE/StbE
VKLSGKEYYRLRQGVFRILYEVRDSVLVVCVVKVAHRRNIHRN